MTYFERFTPDPFPLDYQRYRWNEWEIVAYDDGYELVDVDESVAVAFSDDIEWLAHCAVLGGISPELAAKYAEIGLTDEDTDDER